MLIERDREVDRLLELLADTVAGEGRLVFVGGEAGVGKTSLMSAVAAAAPSGVEVRRGAADRLTAAAALGAVVDALPELEEMVGDPAGLDRLELFRRIRSMLRAGRRYWCWRTCIGQTRRRWILLAFFSVVDCRACRAPCT